MKRTPKLPRITQWRELLLELCSLTQTPTIIRNDPTKKADIVAVQPEAPEAWKDQLDQRNGTCLCDAVVICQEHRKVLGLLDGLGVCHLPQKLGSSEWEKFTITMTCCPAPGFHHPSSSLHLQLQSSNIRARLEQSFSLSSFYQHGTETHRSLVFVSQRDHNSTDNRPPAPLYPPDPTVGNVHCQTRHRLSPALPASCPSPFVGWMVIFDTALHVLQLIQDSKHVDELAQGEEVGLRDKVLPALRVAQALHLTAEPLDSLALEGGGTGSAHANHHSYSHHPLPSPGGMAAPGSRSVVTMKWCSITDPHNKCPPCWREEEGGAFNPLPSLPRQKRDLSNHALAL